MAEFLKEGVLIMDSQNQLPSEEQIKYAVQPEQPWLLENGKHTPEDQLKTLTPSWSAETWEKYLVWFENQNGQRAESLISPRRYDGICATQEESIFTLSQSCADDDLRNAVGDYLKTLTEQQHRVIEMIFWEGRSERFVSQELGINRGSVHRLKQRALSKIKSLLKGGCSSRIMRGEISPLAKGDEHEANLLLAESRLAEAG